MKTINNFLITNKKVLLRVDFNVPVKNGLIIDNTKINLIKPTIEKLISKNNKIFIVSHFGRPEGKFIKKYSLNFICKILEKEFDLKKVFFSNTVEKKELNTIEKQMSNGDICLIEWANQLPGLIPPQHLEISIKLVGEMEREISIELHD